MSWLKPRPTKILAVPTQTLKWPVHKRLRTRQPRNTQAEACATSIQRHTADARHGGQACGTNSLLKKCSWLPSPLLRGSCSLQETEENADSSSPLLVGMTANRVFQ